MHEELVAPVLAECPRCGGWARRLERAAGRRKCRGCRWTGFVGA